jgi:hypothetical protein
MKIKLEDVIDTYLMHGEDYQSAYSLAIAFMQDFLNSEYAMPTLRVLRAQAVKIYGREGARKNLLRGKPNNKAEIKPKSFQRFDAFK